MCRRAPGRVRCAMGAVAGNAGRPPPGRGPLPSVYGAQVQGAVGVGVGVVGVVAGVVSAVVGGVLGGAIGVVVGVVAGGVVG